VFIVGIIFAILALLGLAAGVLASAPEARRGGRSIFVLGLLLAVGSIVIASMSTVPTRNVGIVTQFNKPTGRTTGAGLQWTAPWQDIDDWDASGQTYAHLDNNCVWVTIAAQRRACIPVQIEWASKADRAPENWAAYKEVDGIDGGRFGTFTARRVNPQINAALTSVFASFDPLGTVDPKSGASPAPDLNKTYKQPLMEALNAALGNDITVRSVAFEAPRYDGPTTAAIAAYGQKVLEARNLTIDKANAITRAEITNTDAKVDQVARCLQIAEKLGKEPGLCMGGGAAVTKPLS
jgi:regulator of protease activity HflC (stomatin/prohibitin superfamily)